MKRDKQIESNRENEVPLYTTAYYVLMQAMSLQVLTVLDEEKFWDFYIKLIAMLLTFNKKKQQQQQ